MSTDRDQAFADAIQTRINSLTADFVNRDDPIQRAAIERDRIKAIAEQTRLTNVKLCFDTGHAHLEGGVVAGLKAIHDLVVTTHVHDNRGERDDHLLPYEGTIDWNAALTALPNDVPFVFELKEPAVAAGSAVRGEIDVAVEVQPLARALRSRPFEECRGAGRHGQGIGDAL